jgi:hypothetical protein
MADAWLRREYVKKLQQLRAQTKESIEQGAVSAGNLSRVEEKWQGYRDVWVAFARLRYLSPSLLFVRTSPSTDTAC